MSSKRLAPKKNTFASLEPESDDEMEIPEPDPPTNTPGQRQPKTLSERFTAAWRGKAKDTIEDLAKTIDQSLRLSASDRAAFKAQFDQYDRSDQATVQELIQAYKVELEKRLNCFSKLDSDFFREVRAVLQGFKNVTVANLIQSAIRELTPQKPKTGHGYLILLDMITNRFEDLPPLEHKNVKNAGPVFAWVVGRMVLRKCLTVDNVLDLFGKEMLTSDPESAPVSVAAAFLAQMAQDGQNVVTAKHFVDVKVICQQKGTHRHEMVSAVMIDVNSDLRIGPDEQRKLAVEVMDRYPRGSSLAAELFIAGAKRQPFVEGWLEAHRTPKYNAISTMYLKHLSDRLDETLLARFPTVRGQSLNDDQALVVRKKYLRNTSIRFLVILILAIAFYCVIEFDVISNFQ